MVEAGRLAQYKKTKQRQQKHTTVIRVRRFKLYVTLSVICIKQFNK